jgi:DNA polymerase III delta prime subunit
MSIPDFELIANEALQTFKEIETVASEKLQSIGIASASAFATANTFTGNRAVQNLSGINQSNKDAYSGLIKEPAIVRLILESGDGVLRTLYISRKSQVSLKSNIELASYGSPKGRLASISAGEDKEIEIAGKREIFYVVEKLTLHPTKSDNDWDSVDNFYSHDKYDGKTITSLRALLKQTEIDFSDELEQLLSDAKSSTIIIDGVRHQVRAAMSLRDQPILDKFQDEIFRLPLDSQLIILGPPGTGKTTTLIKRLGQKLDLEYLDDSEKRLVDNSGNTLPHQSSWLMFKPSELLKHYLKDAFSREMVPASDDRIKTWVSYRNDLARNTFGVLKTANGGKYTLKADINVLTDNVINAPEIWIKEFKNAHWEKIISQLEQGREQVAASALIQNHPLLTKLDGVFANTKKQLPTSLLQQLDTLEKDIRSELDSAKEIADRLVKEQRNLLFNRNKNVFNELAKYLENLSLDEEGDEDGDEDAEFDDESDSQAPTTTEVQKAVNAYVGFIKTYSRLLYLGRSLSKQSKATKVKDWLADRTPPKEILQQIGQQITYQNGLRRFLNVPKRYAFGAVASYADFRKKNSENLAWYNGIPTLANHIDGTELDAIIFLILQNTRELLDQNFVSRNLDAPKFSTLKDFTWILRNQIMVDEATDFSVLQLASMRYLTSNQTNSFFACGDFNQRITHQGVKDLKQLQWAIPNLLSQHINIVYRQSKLLNEFARSLIEITDGDINSLGELPSESTHEGSKPALLENAGNIENIADWIAERIKKIESTLGILPTIAVLVNNESEVKLMANLLSKNLEELNLKAVACEEGKSLGEGTDVRVFDIQHIKGLEFEAVFFAGLDKLAVDKPEIFDRYLYVGATRAATYLGIVCYDSIPEKLMSIRENCVLNW